MGRPREERCYKKVCMGMQAELRETRKALAAANNLLERERAQRAVLIAGELRCFQVERDDAVAALATLQAEHRCTLSPGAFVLK